MFGIATFTQLVVRALPPETQSTCTFRAANEDVRQILSGKQKPEPQSRWRLGPGHPLPDTASLLRRARRMGSMTDRKSTRLNSSHGYISYAVFCLKKKN